MNTAVERLRNLSDLGFEVAMDKIKSKRQDKVFVSDTPYTPICLIDEIIDCELKLQQNLDINICVLYTIEMAFRLAYRGCDNISIYLLEEDIEIEKYCNVFGFKYCIIEEGKKDMEKKFDLVIGNPPFSKNVVEDKNTKGKSVQIWPNFIRWSDELCEDNGTIALIHPNNWRDIGDPYNLWNLMTSKQIEKINMFTTKDSRDFFNIELKFDYVVSKNMPKNDVTTVVYSNGIKQEIDLDDKDFLFSAYIEELESIIAEDGEERVKLLHDSTYHTQNNGKIIMSKEKTDEFKYPCVYIVKNNGGATYWYSNEDKGHFGIPKVIFANGLYSCMADKTGEYGLTQFAKAIVDTVDNLEKIKQAMESKEFIKLISAVSCNKNSYDHKLIRLLRKDFWKDFV